MNISRELIEKYHSGKCSPEEEKAVEDWLLNDEDEVSMAWPVETEKDKLEAAMWQEISTVIPAKPDDNSRALWWRLSAAAVFLIALGMSLYLMQRPTDEAILVSANNTSETTNKDLNENAFTLSLGPKSNVAIDSRTGMIDFCGSMLINPKKDMELTFHGSCVNASRQQEKIVLKKGQSYVALQYNSGSNANEVIVVEEGSSMIGLPPLVMKQLMTQFNI